jgi:hypothetical protein
MSLIHVRFPPRFVSATVASTLALAVAFAPGPHRVSAQSGPPPPPVPNGSPLQPVTTPQAAGNPAALPSNAPIPTSAPSAFPSAAPSTEGRGRRHRRESSASPEPSPSATPTSPAFATLDGTWETQVQYIDRTDYSYLVIKQNATGEISGLWRVNGKAYPFDGSYDGRLIRLLVKEPSGNLTWSGYVEGASDIVGTIDFGQGKADPTPFTAEHRAAAKNPFKKEIPEKKS